MKNRIREFRSEKGLSQAQLAAAVGIARQSINAIENQRHDPSVTLAFAIAAALGRGIEDVFVRGNG
jgi:putative transcriptional regulator